MSYQLSATPDMDIPASEKRIYIYSCSAIRFEGLQHAARDLKADYTEASSEESAKITARRQANSWFPECEGWLKHQIEIQELPPGMTVEKINNRLVLKEIVS